MSMQVCTIYFKKNVDEIYHPNKVKHQILQGKEDLAFFFFKWLCRRIIFRRFEKASWSLEILYDLRIRHSDVKIYGLKLMQIICTQSSSNPYGKLRSCLSERKRRPHTVKETTTKNTTLTFDCFGNDFLYSNQIESHYHLSITKIWQITLKL